MKIKVVKIGKKGEGEQFFTFTVGSQLIGSQVIRKRAIMPEVLKVAIFGKWNGEGVGGVCVNGGRDSLFLSCMFFHLLLNDCYFVHVLVNSNNKLYPA